LLLSSALVLASLALAACARRKSFQSGWSDPRLKVSRWSFDLTSRISSSIDAFYTHDQYHSLTTGVITPVAPFTENAFDIGLGVHYAVTPLVGVQVGYHYTDISSDFAFRDYSRNRVSGGVSLKF